MSFWPPVASQPVTCPQRLVDIPSAKCLNKNGRARRRNLPRVSPNRETGAASMWPPQNHPPLAGGFWPPQAQVFPAFGSPFGLPMIGQPGPSAPAAWPMPIIHSLNGLAPRPAPMLRGSAARPRKRSLTRMVPACVRAGSDRELCDGAALRACAVGVHAH